MIDPTLHYPDFAERVRAKLARGSVVFENRSFSKSPVDLAAEIQDELIDICGWSFVLWSRLETMRVALEAAQNPPEPHP